jgi:hypothetical protein
VSSQVELLEEDDDDGEELEEMEDDDEFDDELELDELELELELDELDDEHSPGATLPSTVNGGSILWYDVSGHTAEGSDDVYTAVWTGSATPIAHPVVTWAQYRSYVPLL